MSIHTGRAKEVCKIKMGKMPEERFGKFKVMAKYLGRIKAKVTYHICIHVEQRSENSLEHEMEVKLSQRGLVTINL